jgi:hypothetical protein
VAVEETGVADATAAMTTMTMAAAVAVKTTVTAAMTVH